MEGDGESMVAIVRGLDDAGITLTVVSTKQAPKERQNQDRSESRNLPKKGHSARNMLPVTRQRSSVETCTDSAVKASTGVQICDGRYASSYRIAHCSFTPTSPPIRLSEFPPQRKEPCISRNQGNFVVGGNGSGEVRSYTSGRSKRYWGGQAGQQQAQRGLVHNSSRSNQDTNAFVHSLRRYPSQSPGRTMSTDLIDKLIKYTQDKNSPRTSRPTKSLRSLKDQSADTDEVPVTSTHQQTYIRPQNDESPSNNRPLGYKGRTRNFKLYSPIDSRNFKRREAPISTSYDYLKAGSSHLGESPNRSERPSRSNRPSRADRPSRANRPSRFDRLAGSRDARLADISRYIRSTIRQIYEDRPVVFQVCPKLKNRYNEHKKSCPIQNRDSMINDSDPQASAPLMSRLITSLSGCAVPFTDAAGLRSGFHCFCSESTQCGCDSDSSASSFEDPKTGQHLKLRYCYCGTNTSDKSSQNPNCTRAPIKKLARFYCSEDDQIYYKKRIDEEICDWLEDVPVRSIECPENKNRRENMINELRSNLKKLPDDENFEDSAKTVINNFIDDFPIWYPKDRKDEEQFKQKIADKLLEKILNIPRKPDRFIDIVNKFFKSLNFDSEVNMEIIIDDFVEKLKALAVDRPESDKAYKEILIKEIGEMLEELPLNIKGDKNEKFKQMANKLAAQIVCIPMTIDLTKDRTDLKDEIEEILSDWLNELCMLRENFRELKRDPKLIESLARKLNKLQAQGIDDKAVTKKMQEEVRKFMADVDIAQETLDELIEDLIERISTTVKTNEMENLDQDELVEKINDWLRNISGFNDLPPQRFGKIAKELSYKIREAKIQGKEDYQKDIIDTLVTADVSVDPIVLVRNIEDLTEILKKWPSRKQFKEKAKDKIIKEVDKIIDAATITKDKKRELKNKLTNIVSTNLDSSLLDSENAQDDAKDALIEGMETIIDDTDISEGEKSDLKTKLGDALIKTFDETLSSLVKDNIAKYIKNIVKNLPINSQKKKDLMMQVKDEIQNKLYKPLPDDIKDTLKKEISDIIAESPISEDRNLRIKLKNKILAVASKVINMFSPQYKNVGSIYYKLEKDLFNVIDKTLIDIDTKINLKQDIQNILTKNEDQRLSDEVKETVKEEIFKLVDDLSEAEDQKDSLKSAIHDTLTKNFDDALLVGRKDIHKIKTKMMKDFKFIIEKLPIHREEKNKLKNKLKQMLARNLDTSLSDEQKRAIIDNVSNIISDALPEDKRIDVKTKLTNTLANKLDTKPQNITNEIESIIDKLSLSSDEKSESKNKSDTMLSKDVSRPLFEKSKLSQVLAKSFTQLPDQVEDWEGIDHIKETIVTDISSFINTLPISEANKKSLIWKVKAVLAENLDQPTTDDLQDTINDRLSNLLDGSSISILDSNQVDIEDKIIGIEDVNLITKDVEEVIDNIEIDLIKKDKMLPKTDITELKAKENIMLGIDRSIDVSPIPKEKKMELKNKLKKMAAENLNKPLTGDVLNALNEGTGNILDEIALPKDEKNKLKNKLTTIIVKNVDYFRDEEKHAKHLEELRTHAQNNIMQGLEKSIENASIPKDKKIELKQKLKNMVTKIFEQPLSGDLQDALKVGIAGILEEVPLPKGKKSQLKNELTEMVDVNMQSVQDKIKKTDAKFVPKLEIKTQNNILQGMEKSIDEALISKEKKQELKQKIKDMATRHFNKPLSGDVLKDGINSILEEIPLPKHKKNQLKNELTGTVDENIQSLEEIKKKHIADQTKKEEKTKSLLPQTDVMELKAKENIIQEIEKSIDVSPIPKEKKIELKNKLKKMAAENLNKPLTNEVKNALNEGIGNILDEIELPKDEKNKLKNKLTTMIDKNVDFFRDEEKHAKHLEKLRIHAQNNIMQGLEKSIENASIPKDKKIELKQKLKNMATKNFEQPLSGDLQDALKEGIEGILEEVILPKEKKSQLKNELTHMVEVNMQSVQDEIKKKDAKRVAELEAKTRDHFLQEIEKSIDEAPISKEKKHELKKRIEDMATKNFNKPLSVDVLKHGINGILEEIPLLKHQKNQLKNKLTGTVDESIQSLEEIKKKHIADQTKKEKKTKSLLTQTDVEEFKVKENIMQGIDESVDVLPIPKEKKMELKNKLKKMAAENLNKPLTDDIKNALNAGIGNILYEIALPQDDKNKLINKLTTMVDKNVDSFRDKKKEAKYLEELKTHAQNNIMQGLEKSIDEASIPKEKKAELKRKLKDMSTKNFGQPMSDDVKNALRDDISKILDELPLSNDKKNELTGMIDENICNLRNYIKAEKSILDSNGEEKKERKNLLLQIEQDKYLKEEIDVTEDIPEISSKEVSEQYDYKEFYPGQTSTPRKRKSSESRGVHVIQETTAKEYADELINSIKTWIDRMAIHLDPRDKSAIINALASDIVDRQKYLQVHPEARSTDQEELDNLKFQVFRRLSKVVDPGHLTEIINETEKLMKEIAEIEVPRDISQLHTNPGYNCIRILDRFQKF